MNDPIVDEIRRIRNAHAARFNYDLEAIFRDIKQQEKKSGRKFVSFASGEAAGSQPHQPTGAAIPTAGNAELSPPAPAIDR